MLKLSIELSCMSVKENLGKVASRLCSSDSNYDTVHLNLGWEDVAVRCLCFSSGRPVWRCLMHEGPQEGCGDCPRTYSPLTVRVVILHEWCHDGTKVPWHASQPEDDNTKHVKTIIWVFIVFSIKWIKASCPFGHRIRGDFLGQWDIYSLEIKCPIFMRERVLIQK